MNKHQLKALGVACLLVCGLCVFVAVERYVTNASRVRSIGVGESEGSIRLVTGEIEAVCRGSRDGVLLLEPVTPTMTLYAGLFAAISGIGGIVLLKRSKM
jgi:hypothetical protein